MFKDYITDRERDAHRAIKAFHKLHGCTPSARQLAELMGLKSSNSSHKYIHALINAGLLEQTELGAKCECCGQRIGGKVKLVEMYDKIMTVEEVASFLKISREAVHKRIIAGTLPARKIGRDYHIDREELLASPKPKVGRPKKNQEPLLTAPDSSQNR